MDGSPAGSSLHGLSLARILERVAMSYSGGPSRPRDWTVSPTLMGDSLLWNQQGRLLLIFLFIYFHILKVFIRISYKIHFKCKVFTAQWKGIFIYLFIYLFCLSMHYFQVFYYLVWVVRIFEDFDSPFSPSLYHFLLCSAISVASISFSVQFIQSHRPTIKNWIFHKVSDSPSYGSA